MIEILKALPVILKWVPELVDVVADALGGGEHYDEGAWCESMPALKDVCDALRNQDTTAVWAVRQILRDANPDRLRAAMELLAKKMQ